MRYRPHLSLIAVVVFAFAISGCSKPAPQAQPSSINSAAPPTQPVAPPNPSQSPAASGQSVPVNLSAAVPGGPAASEEHSLSLTNYSNVAVTATLNGTWIGQWDSSSSVPLDSVLKGKNELRIDVAQQPNAEVLLEINAQRNGQTVNLLCLNFGNKPAGSYTYYFAAR